MGIEALGWGGADVTLVKDEQGGVAEGDVCVCLFV